MHILIILFFLMVSVCHAEEPQTVNQELDEVIVSASRVEEKVKEVPATVNIVTNKEIEEVKFRNAAEVSHLNGHILGEPSYSESII